MPSTMAKADERIIANFSDDGDKSNIRVSSDDGSISDNRNTEEIDG